MIRAYLVPGLLVAPLFVLLSLCTLLDPPKWTAIPIGAGYAVLVYAVYPRKLK